MEFIKTVINPLYWITHQTAVPEAWVTGLVIFFGLILLIGIMGSILSIMKYFKKPYRNLFFRFAVWGWVMAALGATQLFFSVERIWVLSARGFFLLWFFIAVYWLYQIVKYAMNDVPRLIARHKEMVAREKYLPKRKK